MAGPEPLILVIEDDAQLSRFLRISLEQHGFRCHACQSGSDGLLQATAHNPDLVLLDLGLPDMEGLEVIRRIREWTAMPILIISARHQEDQKVEALDQGADDFITKPFGVAELLARIRVALRNAARLKSDEKPSLFEAGDLKVDLAARSVRMGSNEIHLTPIEFKLLATLVKHAGKVLTHRQILREVWGPNSEFESQYLRVYMNQLRRKIEPEPAKPKYLITETGIGYRLKS